MSMRHVQGRSVSEDVADVAAWLRGLDGCPPVSATATLACHDHGDEPATWFYVEADAGAGVARVRCLGCGRVQHLLDSESRWTYPSAWACSNCRQSIAEVVVGGHVPADDGRADWIAVGLRCVDCGAVAGVADAVVTDPMPVEAVFGEAVLRR